ncbi:ATP-binding protein [Leptolyngbya sp. PL-A3]|uniref:sensor histidine kinase n=1 Tax=Leptolyngbya sp. PL-A3 TaxID=2933911 RepID=UPI0032987ED7
MVTFLSKNLNVMLQGSNQRTHSTVFWVVIVLFGCVAFLELVTSIDAVFSYLYVGPILLANFQVNRGLAIRLTVLASILTILNLWIPGSDIIKLETVENRLIAVLALIVTEILSYRNRRFEEALAQNKAALQLQDKLTSVREDFVFTLTHDLKTPLLGAIETIKVLKQEQFGSVTLEQHQVFTTMVRSHQSSLQLLETLLDIYRNDAEGVSLARSPVKIVNLIEQTIEALSNLASNYQVSLNLRCNGVEARNLVINVDALQLQRVISNLFINAINHSPSNSRIDIVVDIDGNHSNLQQVIKVMDEGPGIQPNELSQLFERFYQGHSDRQAKGSGLGLYLARQIIEAHGGTIWAENRASHGAIFAFSLPV